MNGSTNFNTKKSNKRNSVDLDRIGRLSICRGPIWNLYGTIWECMGTDKTGTSIELGAALSFFSQNTFLGRIRSI